MRAHPRMHGNRMHGERMRGNSQGAPPLFLHDYRAAVRAHSQACCNAHATMHRPCIRNHCIRPAANTWNKKQVTTEHVARCARPSACCLPARRARALYFLNRPSMPFVSPATAVSFCSIILPRSIFTPSTITPCDAAFFFTSWYRWLDASRACANRAPHTGGLPAGGGRQWQSVPRPTAARPATHSQQKHTTGYASSTL